MVETMIDASDYGYPETVDIAFPDNANIHAKAIQSMLNELFDNYLC